MLDWAHLIFGPDSNMDWSAVQPIHHSHSPAHLLLPGLCAGCRGIRAVVERVVDQRQGQLHLHPEQQHGAHL